MATKRKRNNMWEARIQWRDSDGRKREKPYSLDTTKEDVADIRMIYIRENEGALKRGVDISFPWENDTGEVKIVRYNLESAKSHWHKSLITNRLASGSIDIYLQAIDCLIDVCGAGCHVNDVKYQHIESLKASLSHLADETLNMKLRAIHTLFVWLHDNEKVSTIPKIKKLPIGRKLPCYYSAEEFDLVQCHVDNELYRRAYILYRDTGLRLFEVFKSTISNTGLIIPSGRTKNSYERTMELNDEQMDTVRDMRAWVKYKVDNEVATERCAVKHISRIWSDTCKKVGLEKRKMHNLRHTFAVMEWLRTSDLLLVSSKLGHSSTSQTEKYTKFEESELIKDFPIEAVRLCDGGQVLEGSYQSDYNYGKA